MSDTLGPRDAKIKAMIEQETLLRDLTLTPGWQEYVRLANVSISAWQERMNSGALDFDDYKHVAGFLLGARQTLEIPDLLSETLRRLERQIASDETEDYPLAEPFE